MHQYYYRRKEPKKREKCSRFLSRNLSPNFQIPSNPNIKIRTRFSSLADRVRNAYLYKFSQGVDEVKGFGYSYSIPLKTFDKIRIPAIIEMKSIWWMTILKILRWFFKTLDRYFLGFKTSHSHSHSHKIMCKMSSVAAFWIFLIIFQDNTTNNWLLAGEFCGQMIKCSADITQICLQWR